MMSKRVTGGRRTRPARSDPDWATRMLPTRYGEPVESPPGVMLEGTISMEDVGSL